MKKSVEVKPYYRKKNGKIFKVKGHKRVNRKLGGKVRYRKAGTFYVAHDDQGNFRGSKIIMPKESKTQKSNKTSKSKKSTKKSSKRSRLSNMPQKLRKRELDKDYFDGDITFKEWINKRSKLD